jgi:radical SAM superfamily enzyme YgiQ (UPF0313 family)
LQDATVILVTCQSTQAAEYLKSLRARFRNKIIICGGSASTSPHSLGKHVDMVCVGDGQFFLSVLIRDGIEKAKRLSNVWIDGENRRVNIDQNFPWDMPPIQGESGAYHIYCGRGCKNKCRFCQTGWAYEYKECPNSTKTIIQAQSLIARGKKISYLSNDVSQHSFYEKLPPTECGSYSVNYLKKSGLPPARQIRLGIEGVSERLRISVSKPISYSDLLGCTKWLNTNGKSVRWFLVAGLPTELSSDWNELKQIVQQWKMETLKGVLALSFTAFCPDPATPMATAAINDDYWNYFDDFKRWFFGGRGFSNRIKLMPPQQPEARMKKAMLSMGLSELQLRTGGVISPNSRIVYPYTVNKCKKDEAIMSIKGEHYA